MRRSRTQSFGSNRLTQSLGPMPTSSATELKAIISPRAVTSSTEDSTTPDSSQKERIDFSKEDIEALHTVLQSSNETALHIDTLLEKIKRIAQNNQNLYIELQSCLQQTEQAHNKAVNTACNDETSKEVYEQYCSHIQALYDTYCKIITNLQEITHNQKIMEMHINTFTTTKENLIVFLNDIAKDDYPYNEIASNIELANHILQKYKNTTAIDQSSAYSIGIAKGVLATRRYKAFAANINKLAVGQNQASFFAELAISGLQTPRLLNSSLDSSNSNHDSKTDSSNPLPHPRVRELRSPRTEKTLDQSQTSSVTSKQGVTSC